MEPAPLNAQADTRELHRSAMARILDLVQLSGFDQLPPGEQDYLIDLVVCQVHGRTMPYPPPWSKDKLS